MSEVAAPVVAVMGETDRQRTDFHASANNPPPLWSRFACARCRYRWERPGTPDPGDLSGDCPLCHGQLQAVTVFRAREARARNVSEAGCREFQGRSYGCNPGRGS